MPDELTNEAIRLIQRLGFVFEGEQAIHKKMDVAVSRAELSKFNSLDDLSDYLKTALRDS